MRSILVLAALALGMACDESDSGTTIGAPYEDARVSACGGFGAAARALTSAEYCAAEALDWRYDSATGDLALTHSRVGLNCCGQHAVAAEWNGDTLAVAASDAPDGDRCRCDCVFDFALTVTGVSIDQSPLHLAWDLAVSEAAAARVVFDGDLDLSQGSGRVVLSDAPVMGCE